MNFTNNRLSMAVLILSFALLIGGGIVLTADRSAAAGDYAGIPLRSDIQDGGYYLSTTVQAEFAVAVQQLKDALRAEGFGVLSEIDFQGKMEEKIGAELPPYVILGACNPPLANAVYQDEGWIGTLMPCSFVVRQLDDGSVGVGATNPMLLPMATGNPDLELAARELADLVSRVLGAL